MKSCGMVGFISKHNVSIIEDKSKEWNNHKNMAFEELDNF